MERSADRIVRVAIDVKDWLANPQGNRKVDGAQCLVVASSRRGNRSARSRRLPACRHGSRRVDPVRERCLDEVFGRLSAFGCGSFATTPQQLDFMGLQHGIGANNNRDRWLYASAARIRAWPSKASCQRRDVARPVPFLLLSPATSRDSLGPSSWHLRGMIGRQHFDIHRLPVVSRGPQPLHAKAVQAFTSRPARTESMNERLHPQSWRHCLMLRFLPGAVRIRFKMRCRKTARFSAA